MSLASEPASLDGWARAYVESSSLAYKFAPPSLPEAFTVDATTTHLAAHERFKLRPGRPSELRVVWDKYKAPKSAHALSSPQKRAHLLHTFLHHELQAAELMCWAVVCFPDTPTSFRRGLLSICQDEIRHMKMYSDHIEGLGYRVGDFPVRDWFWERTPHASTAVEFVAMMGLGFEAANLDHTARFAEMFRAAGDVDGARLQEQVGEEEISHVAFAAHWFRQLQGELTFESWKHTLPSPLSPMVMRGKPVQRGARERAGMGPTFLDELEAWQPQPRG